MNDFENISSISSDGEILLNKRYKIIKKIGEGSYGIVFKCIDIKNHNNFVAIKQVSKLKINSSAYLIEALKKELSIMRLLSDENSVKLIEDFETKDYYNLVMELCDSDLDIQLKKHFEIYNRGFNELEVYEIMTQFNSIFLKMYKEHVIHRDLKLKNIMIKFNSQKPIIGFIIKLSDFGFSKVMNEDEITVTNLGSPATKAPEIMEGKDYNAKADLWSVGVIMYQLFYNRLPFPAKNARELKLAIFNSNGVQKPQDSENDMSEICFGLIDKLLQKDPKNRINFEEYFKHEFFSDEHKIKLINKLEKKKQERQINKEKKIENKDNIINDIINQNNLKDNRYNKSEVQNNNIEISKSFEKRFIKILKIKEYKLGFNLYKAKDNLDDTYVYIKEILRSMIDNNVRNKKIFQKEIELLSTLKGKKFPEYKGLFKTDTHYNIIIEYFSGNNLSNFINHCSALDELLVSLILKQLIPSLNELSERNIILEFISPKNFSFKYYQNETNFEIKFFDFGLSSIFFEDKYINNYLLDEADLGNVNDSSINILGIGLTVYKMLFGEEASIKKNGDYEVKIKGKIKSESKEKIKNFLSRCIKKENRYNWEEFFSDEFVINSKFLEQKCLNYKDKKREPLIKDENIEIIFQIIINKLNYIISYFDKVIVKIDNFSETELYHNYYDEIISFLLLCILECKTILQFLKIDSNTNNSKIAQTNQEIHLFKIYLNNNNKDNKIYDYSYINFVKESKNNSIFLYNKENPTFELYFKIFTDIKLKLDTILSNTGIFITNNSSNCIDISNSSSGNFSSTVSPILNNTNNINDKAFNGNIDLRSEKDVKIKEVGNIDKLFFKFFEKGNMYFCFNEKDKAIEELKIAKYIAEYIIFLKAILGNKDITINFEKIMLDDINKIDKQATEKDYIIISTFLGGNINILKKIGILGNNIDGSKDNLNENEPTIDNIKIYNSMIKFYPRILQFISNIEKEI